MQMHRFALLVHKLWWFVCAVPAVAPRAVWRAPLQNGLFAAHAAEHGAGCKPQLQALNGAGRKPQLHRLAPIQELFPGRQLPQGAAWHTYTHNALPLHEPMQWGSTA
eukprot:1151273-Pelagomonas_calceolata.AAC.2